MRIIAVLFTILGLATAIQAQGQQSALQGLVAYGVTLSGSPENPVIENHSGKVVIGYDVKFADANGGWKVENWIMADSIMPAGIPDGGSVYARGGLPINPTVPMASPLNVIVAGQGPIVTATLRSVIFSDGQFVGADEQRSFDQFATKLKAISEVGTLAKTQAWDQVGALYQAFTQRRQAPPPGLAEPPTFVAPPPSVEDSGSTSGQSNTRILTNFRQIAALRLVQTRKFKGEAAADQLAEVYSSLTTLWK